MFRLSTIIGILVRIAKRMAECGGPRVTVISGQGDVDELLGALGLDEVFDIVDADGNGWGLEQEIPTAAAGGKELARTVLEAHRLLMDLNERNGDQFRDVVALFEKQAAGELGSD